MRDWPAWLHTSTAQLLNKVEQEGVWPTDLPGPMGILLPKGGTDDPLDRRPIWLMPMIYRVWATRRASSWARWRLSWPGEKHFAGADALAWEVALEIEAAAAEDTTFGILALDWKKAYDGVSLDTLALCLTKAGVPDLARLPLLGMYSAPRRLRVSNVLGDTWEPTCGIPAGCSIAVLALEVCTHPWAVLTGLVPTLSRRLYVDDSTGWATGSPNAVAEAIIGCGVVTRQFEQAMCWDLHPKKSVVGC